MLDLPAIVVEADAPTIARPLSSLRPNEVRALGAYGEKNGVRAVALPAQAKPGALPVDPERAARILRVEEILRAVRAPLDLGDREQLADVRAKVALAYAETRAHPEDPEAPFLAAEALRTLARAEELAGDAASAAALRARADLFDGGRLVGLSEGTAAVVTTEVARVELTIAFPDATDQPVLFIDGEPRDSKLSLPPGEHHLRVVLSGATVLARWFSLAAGAPQSVALPIGAGTTACSERDLSPALSASSFTVSCARWLRVVRRPAALEVRVCSSTSCGAASEWSTVPVTAQPPPITEETSVLRSKWTWIGVGAAVVIGGAITAWRLGAFDSKEPGPATWRWEGVR